MQATQNSYTWQTAKQTPCSYCYVVVHSDGVAKAPVMYCGENAIKHFMENLQAELVEINEVFRKSADMMITDNDTKAFTDAADYHICGAYIFTLLFSVFL